LNDELSLEDDTFSLRSVVHHLGTTAFSGHYLCDSVRVDIEERSERWVRFDDGLAKETSLSALIENEKNRGDAYMLMYTK
jgi:ubiquitin C-terminal hydrolase